MPELTIRRPASRPRTLRRPGAGSGQRRRRWQRATRWAWHITSAACVLAVALQWLGALR